jgi:hypothetical protein
MASANLLLIDSRIPDINGITSSLTGDTDHIIFDYYHDTFESIKQKINKQYVNVGLIQHNYEQPTCKILDAMNPAIISNVALDDPELITWDVSLNKPIYVDVSSIQYHEINEYVFDEYGDPVIIWNQEYQINVVDVSNIQYDDEGQPVMDENGNAVVVWRQIENFELVDVSSIQIKQVSVPLLDKEGNPVVVWTKEKSGQFELTMGFFDFLRWLKENGAQNIDFLACYLWASADWRYVIGKLREDWGVWVRASIDVTGWGGNFILESDGVDLIGTYFTEKIFQYKYAFVNTTLSNIKQPSINAIDISGSGAYVYWNYYEQFDGSSAYTTDALKNYGDSNNDSNIVDFTITTNPARIYLFYDDKGDPNRIKSADYQLFYTEDIGRTWTPVKNFFPTNTTNTIRGIFYIPNQYNGPSGQNITLSMTDSRIVNYPDGSYNTPIGSIQNYGTLTYTQNVMDMSGFKIVISTTSYTGTPVYWITTQNFTDASMITKNFPRHSTTASTRTYYMSNYSKKNNLFLYYLYLGLPVLSARIYYTNCVLDSSNSLIFNSYTPNFFLNTEIHWSDYFEFYIAFTNNYDVMISKTGLENSWKRYNTNINTFSSLMTNHTILSIKWSSKLKLFYIITRVLNTQPNARSNILISKNGIYWNIYTSPFLVRRDGLSHITSPNYGFNDDLLLLYCCDLIFPSSYQYLELPQEKVHFMTAPSNTKYVQYTTDEINYYDISATQPLYIPNITDISSLKIRVVDTDENITLNSNSLNINLYTPIITQINTLTHSDSNIFFNVFFTQPVNNDIPIISYYKYTTNNWQTFDIVDSYYNPLTINGLTSNQLYSISIKAYSTENNNDSLASNTFSTYSSTLLSPIITNISGGNVSYIYGQQFNFTQQSVVNNIATSAYYNVIDFSQNKYWATSSSTSGTNVLVYSNDYGITWSLPSVLQAMYILKFINGTIGGVVWDRFIFPFQSIYTALVNENAITLQASNVFGSFPCKDIAYSSSYLLLLSSNASTTIIYSSGSITTYTSLILPAITVPESITSLNTQLNIIYHANTNKFYIFSYASLSSGNIYIITYSCINSSNLTTSSNWTYNAYLLPTLTNIKKTLSPHTNFYSLIKDVVWLPDYNIFVAAANTRTASNQGSSILLNNIYILTSTNGVTWNEQKIIYGNENSFIEPLSLCYESTLNLLIMTVTVDSIPYIAISRDSIKWKFINSNIKNMNFKKIIYDSYNQYFLTIGTHTTSTLQTFLKSSIPTNIQKLQYTLNGSTFYDLPVTQPVTIPNHTTIDISSIAIRFVDTDNNISALSDIYDNTTVTGISLSVGSVPSAPTITSLTPGDGIIYIFYDPPSNDGGSSITEYIYNYKISTETLYTPVSVSGDTYPITITGLTNGTLYDVYLIAVNSFGESAATDVSSATPRTVPGIPTIYSLTPGNGTITIDYDLTIYDGGSPITEYIYSYKVSTDTVYTHVTISGDTYPITITGLTNGISYDVYLVARNTEGDSPATDVSSATPRTVPDPPTITSVISNNTSITITYNPPSNDGGSPITEYKCMYKAYNDTGDYITMFLSNINFLITIIELINGIEYEIYFVATNDAGDSAPSDLFYATPRTIPSAPSIYALYPDNGTITIDYDPPIDDGGSSVTEYIYSYKVSTDTQYTHISVSGDTYPITITELTNGTLYDVYLVATNIAGDSPATDVSSSTPRTIPDPPSIISLISGDGTITITHASPAFNGGSPITEYKYIYKAYNDSDYTTISVSSDTYSITVTELTNGIEYEIYVVATNDAGDSALSDLSYATPKRVPDAPTITGLTVSDATIIIAYDPPFYNGGSPITEYKYSYRVYGDTQYTTVSVSGDTYPITITELYNGASYDIYLVATNIVGDSSATDISSAIPMTVPSIPIINSITGYNSSIIIDYDVETYDGGSPIIEYNYTYGYKVGGEYTYVSLSTNSYPIIITGLTNGTLYDVSLVAINKNGYSSATDVSSVTPVPVPSEPIFVSVVPGDTSIYAEFLDPVSDGGFPILSYKYTIDSYESVNIGIPTNRSFLISNLFNGVSYTISLIAFNQFGYSPPAYYSVTPRTVPLSPVIEDLIMDNSGAVPSVTIKFVSPTNLGGSSLIGYRYKINNGSFVPFELSYSPTTTYRHTIHTGFSYYNTYSIVIDVSNAAGYSLPSNSYSITLIPRYPKIESRKRNEPYYEIIFSDGFYSGQTVKSYAYSVNIQSTTFYPIGTIAQIENSSNKYFRINKLDFPTGILTIRLRSTYTNNESYTSSQNSFTGTASFNPLNLNFGVTSTDTNVLNIFSGNNITLQNTTVAFQNLTFQKDASANNTFYKTGTGSLRLINPIGSSITEYLKDAAFTLDSSGITFAFWMKSADFSTEDGYTSNLIMYASTTSETNSYIQTYIQNNLPYTDFKILLKKSGTLYNYTFTDYDAKSLFNDQWNHVCLTMNGNGTYKLYINSILVSCITGATYPLSGIEYKNPTSGFVTDTDASYKNAHVFNGYVDEFRLYNGRVLNAAEIKQLYTYVGGFMQLNTDATIYEPFDSADYSVMSAKLTFDNRTDQTNYNLHVKSKSSNRL